jgi:hypothetical protein
MSAAILDDASSHFLLRPVKTMGKRQIFSVCRLRSRVFLFAINEELIDNERLLFYIGTKNKEPDINQIRIGGDTRNREGGLELL